MTMSSDNGNVEAQLRMQKLVTHLLPEGLTPGVCNFISSHVRDPKLGREIVVVVFHKEGASFSQAIEADTAIQWGEVLAQTGRNAKSGLITP